MRITVARGAGYCGGVKKAVSLALELAEKHGKVFTIGALIHNEGVVSYLAEKGAVPVTPEEAEALPEGSVALIRAHGVPWQLEERLRERGVVLADATCPVVKKIHRIVSERYAAGDYIAIVGDAGHDEVIGAASYGRDRVRVISEPEDLDDCPRPVSVVFQTTVLAEKYEKFLRYAENSQKKGEKTVGIFNTICYTTLSRQEEARSLARESDAVIVLGSRSSANTRRLFEAARAENEHTFFAERADEVPLTLLTGMQKLSVVAGASTPPRLIREVTQLMSETTQNDAVEVITAEETVADKEATLTENDEAAKAADTAANKPERSRPWKMFSRLRVPRVWGL